MLIAPSNGIPGFKQNKFSITDHICRECSKRILQYLGPAVTGGGNPLFVCSGCEKAGASMGPHPLCWCGQKYDGHTNKQIYMCYRIPDKSSALPSEVRALGSMGFSVSGNLKVGVILVEDYMNSISPERNALKKP